ncbi:MAG: hypothetical protein LQ350_005325 [Teloschistes chrysophthalmus]|nr:MAG: hypothetical protein LQ350_005325 [Niorma chrysophthalma]
MSKEYFYFQRRQRVWNELPSIDTRLETEIESISLNSISWTDGSVTPSSLLEINEHTPPDPPSFWKRTVRERHLKRQRRAQNTRLKPTYPFTKLHDGFHSIDSRLDVGVQSGSPTSITWTDGSVTPIIVRSALVGDEKVFRGPKKVGTAGCLHPTITVPSAQATTNTKDAVQKMQSPGNMLDRLKRWYRGHADADMLGYVTAHLEPQGKWHHCQACSEDGKYLRFHAANARSA